MKCNVSPIFFLNVITKEVDMSNYKFDIPSKTDRETFDYLLCEADGAGEIPRFVNAYKEARKGGQSIAMAMVDAHWKWEEYIWNLHYR